MNTITAKVTGLLAVSCLLAGGLFGQSHSEISNTFALDLRYAQSPTITSHPTNQTVTAPGSATFSVSATGSGSLSYQWQRSTNNGFSWTNMSGATSANYSTGATDAGMNGYSYRVVVTHSAGSVTSNAGVLQVVLPEYDLSTATTGAGTVTADPELSAYAAGTEVTLTATPDEGHVFEGWSGDATGSANPLVVEMDGNWLINLDIPDSTPDDWRKLR